MQDEIQDPAGGGDREFPPSQPVIYIDLNGRIPKATGIQAESEQYKALSAAMSKFHNYNFNNTLLIIIQKTDTLWFASFVKCGRTKRKKKA